MKLFSTLCVLFCCVLVSNAQTKILDSNVNWSANTLTLYLSDSAGISSLNVTLGTAFDSTDVFTHTWLVGSDVIAADNMLQVPLTGITAGNYYLDLKLNMADATIKEMQYQTPAQ